MKVKLLKVIAPLLFFANLAVILVVWWQGALPEIQADEIAGPLLASGRLAGLLAFYLILWQMLLIGRVRWIERAWGHDKLSRVHHFSGIAAISILFFHPVLLTLGYSKLAGTGLFGQFWLFVTSYSHVWMALIAYLMFLGIVIFTLVAISFLIAKKRLRYETWYYVHVTIYLAIALSFFHQAANGHDLSNPGFRLYWYILFALVLLNTLYYRFIKPAIISGRHNFRVERIDKETQDVNSVIITGKNLGGFEAQAGQFVIVRFLATGFWKEAHPFSLSEMPSGRRLRITPKAVGDFTQKIPELSVGTKIIIEGPLGRFTADRATTTILRQGFGGQVKVLLIAGGIGITPLRSLFEEFVKQGREVDLIYAARSEQDFVFKDELGQLANIKAQVYYMPENKTGRLTPELIKQVVPDVAQRFIYLCGPPPMMKAVREQLQSLGVPKSVILYERFQLG